MLAEEYSPFHERDLPAGYELYFTNTRGWNWYFELAGGEDSVHCFTLRNDDHCIDFDNSTRDPPAIDGVSG